MTMPIGSKQIRMLAASVSILCAACSGPGSIEGTIFGEKFQVAEVISQAVAKRESFAVIMFSSRPGLCDSLGSDTLLEDAQLLIVEMAVYNAERDSVVGPQGAGDFEVLSTFDGLPTGPIATVVYRRTDARCRRLVSDKLGIGGTISITSVSNDGAYEGSGSVVLENYDKISLEFSGTPCSALPGFVLDDFQPKDCQ